MNTAPRISSIARFRAIDSAAAITVFIFTVVLLAQTDGSPNQAPPGRVARAEIEPETQDTQPPHPYQSAGTRRMAQLLEELGNDFDRRLMELRPEPTLTRYVRNIKQRSDLRSQTLLAAQEAYSRLLLGGSAEAAQEFACIKDTVLQNPSAFDSNFLNLVREYLAISYLRLGEQENCICQHNSDSCLFPLRGSGVHSIRRGSHAAIGEYTEILNENPQNVTARWLLNIAYMTLGQYPDGVPKRWLIAPKVFQSEYEIKRFYNIAPQLGVDVRGLAGGCILEDFDGDGYLDLMVSSSGLDKQRDQLRYFHNNQ